MEAQDFHNLEKTLKKNGNRNFEGTAKFAVGDKVPYEDFSGAFVKVAFDLWQIDPNVEISGDFWRLDADKKFFVKTYSGGETIPHDRRWSVFPTEDQSKVSVAYKNDPLVTLDVNMLGFKKDNILAAQKSLLKLLSSSDGAASLLGSIDDDIRESFVAKYPELGS